MFLVLSANIKILSDDFTFLMSFAILLRKASLIFLYFTFDIMSIKFSSNAFISEIGDRFPSHTLHHTFR